MPNHNFNKPICFLLFIFSFLISSSAQTVIKSIADVQSDPNTLPIGQPKLVPTNGSKHGDNVHCGLQDKSGNIWFGTTGSGVYRYNGNLFFNYTINNGLSSNCVWSIMEDTTGNIWFGTSNGICRFDGEKISSIPIPLSIRPGITSNSFYTEWSTENTIWSMLQDKSGNIWFGAGDGVYCYTGQNFTRLLANDSVINNENLKLKAVAQILEDDKGNIWFASGVPPGNEGFCRYNGKLIESFKPKNEGWIRNVVKSQNGNLLLATRHYGIWTYDGTSFTDYAQPKDLVKPSLNYILEDQSGRLWVASDYGIKSGDTLGGLWFSNISSSHSTEKTFTKICNKEVYFILEDKESNIWFGTRNTGLFKYDGKTIDSFSE